MAGSGKCSIRAKSSTRATIAALPPARTARAAMLGPAGPNT